MSKFLPRRFAEPGALRRLNPDRLIEFLNRFRAVLEARGLAVPESGGGDIDYDAISRTLLAWGSANSPAFLEALYLINEMSTPRQMDLLLNEVQTRSLAVDVTDSDTPGDVALAVWLKHPELIERKHAEQRFSRRRSFRCYRGRQHGRGRTRHTFDPSAIAKLQTALSGWFQERLRGHWCTVTPHPYGEGTLLIIRHGDAMVRQPSIDGGKSVTTFYRPELFDLVVYDAEHDELWINTEDGVRDEYRCRIGECLLGSEGYFLRSKHYTLEPLRRDGLDALTCSDVAGLERVHLIEITYRWYGSVTETEIRKAPDLFVVWEDRKRGIPPRADIVGAKFRVQFSGTKKWRTVSVTVPDGSGVRRTEDGPLVETWLRLRRFVLTEEANAPDQPVLAGA